KKKGDIDGPSDMSIEGREGIYGKYALCDPFPRLFGCDVSDLSELRSWRVRWCTLTECGSRHQQNECKNQFHVKSFRCDFVSLALASLKGLDSRHFGPPKAEQSSREKGKSNEDDISIRDNRSPQCGLRRFLGSGKSPFIGILSSETIFRVLLLPSESLLIYVPLLGHCAVLF